MRSTLRQFRRAPGRILASIFALALAVGAIGVLAIPSISAASLQEAVERDGLADIIVGTTDLGVAQMEAIGREMLEAFLLGGDRWHGALVRGLSGDPDDLRVLAFFAFGDMKDRDAHQPMTRRIVDFLSERPL